MVCKTCPFIGNLQEIKAILTILSFIFCCVPSLKRFPLNLFNNMRVINTLNG